MIKGMKFTALAVLSVFVITETAGGAPEADISPRVEGGKIVIDAHEDGTGMTIRDARVFVWEFGEIPADPFVIGDPGFNAFSGSGLPVGSRFGVRVLSDLRYWDGAGAVTFGAVPDGETLTFLFGSQSRTAGTGTGELADLFFGPAVSANGGFHEHLNSFLNGSDGNAVPASSDGAEASGGVYLLEMIALVEGGGVEPSDSIFALFNNGLSEGSLDTASVYVQAALVPEPGVGWLVVVGAAFVGSRRGRKRCEVRRFPRLSMFQ